VNDESRPVKAAPIASAAGHVTTLAAPSPTIGDVLLAIEVDLRSAGRRIEWLAVADADLDRESRVVFLSAARIRARRWAS
jgi:hypothetical protein